MFKMKSKTPFYGCIIALVVSILLSSSITSAENKCSSLFKARAKTSVRLAPIKEIDFAKLPKYEELLKEFPGLKPVADYQAQTEVLVLHAASLARDGYNYYLSLIRYLSPSVRTLLVGSKSDYDNFVNYQFKHQVRKTKTGEELDKFLIVENETTPPGTRTPDARWVQDHMGKFVTYNGWDGNPVTAMVTSNYRYSYKISDQLAAFFGIQVIKNISGNHEWGNFTVIGDTGYMVHGSRTHSDLRVEDFMYTGIRKLVLLPQPELQGIKQGIPHVDEFLIPLSKDHIATNVSEYADFFKGQGKKVVLLPSNGDLVLSSDINLSHLNYANAVLVNGENKKILFVPQFGKLKPEDNLFGGRLGREMVKTLKQRDKEALQAYKTIAEELNITVIPVNVAQFTFYNFGGIHCATGMCAVMPTAAKMPSWYNNGDSSL